MMEDEQTHKELNEKPTQKQEKKVCRNDGDSSSCTDDSSDDEYEASKDHHQSSKTASRRLFGRQRPIHKVLGGGKPADLLLWRKKEVSGFVFGTGSALWFIFELLGYHLITLICHVLILAMLAIFFWSKASVYVHKSPPHIPEVTLPRDCVLEVASILRNEINFGLVALRNTLRDVASGKDMKKFLGIIAALWFLSFIGSCFSFLTLFYLGFLLMFSVPLLYEKNEEQVDFYGEMAIAELKKQYAVFDKKVLSQIPIGGSSKKD